MSDNPRQDADYERAQIRFAKASSTWLDAEEVFEAAKKEYFDAMHAMAALDPERADGELGG